MVQQLLDDPAIEIKLGRYENLAKVLEREFQDVKRGSGWKVKYDENKAKVMPLLLKHMSGNT